MHTLFYYLDNEVLGKSRYKVLSFLKMITHLGSSNATFWIRVYLIYSNKKSVLSYLVSVHSKNKLIKNYNIELDKSTKIGIGLKINHPNGIVIGKNVILGKNVTLYHQVTIGVKTNKNTSCSDYPSIGDNCILYSGSKVIGAIKIAEGTKIGANSIVTYDTEPFETYVGTPARKVKSKE